MALLVSDCILETRSLLNDTGVKLFTDGVLLPYFKRAYLKMAQKVRRAGHPLSSEIVTATVNALVTTFPSPPADLFRPVKMFERQVGGTDDDWIPMDEKVWEPNTSKTETLRVFVWREGVIVFLGATTQREVKLRYLKTFPIITAVGDTVFVPDGQMFLAAKTAEYAARYILKDTDRANELHDQAEEDMNDLLGNMIKERQNMVAKRRSYKPKFRRIRTWL